MTLAISIDKDQFRYGSTLFPLISSTPAGADGAVIQIGEWDYLDDSEDAIYWPFRNRSEDSLVVAIRPRTLVDSGDFTTGGGTFDYDFVSGAYVGDVTLSWAYYPTALDGNKCSVEFGIVTVPSAGTSERINLSIQNGDQTIVHDYSLGNAVHAVTLLPSGIGQISEIGSILGTGRNFFYETGDKILLKLESGIVKYFLVKPDRSMVLLRATRSKLTADPKFEFSITGPASVNRLWFSETYEETAEITVIGSLENFQDWNNEFAISSTAESILMANNEPQFTFPNSKKRLRSLAANLALRDKTDRLAYEEFFNWHGVEKEFIFVDKAKTDIDDNSTEWWARFASPFGDKSRNSCLSSHSAQIVESYRKDVVPIEVDDDAATIVLVPGAGALHGENLPPTSLIFTYTDTIIGSLFETAQIYVAGVAKGPLQTIDPVDASQTNISLDFPYSDVGAGSKSVYVIAYDYAGNASQSAAHTYSVTV